MRQQIIIKIAVFLDLAAGIIFHYAGGSVAVVGVPLMFGLAGVGLFFLRIKKRQQQLQVTIAEPKTEISLPRISQRQASDEAEPIQQKRALGAAYRKETWEQTEAVIDGLLDTAINLIRAHLSTYTVAVFFPTHDGGYRLRRFISQSEHINKEAVLYPGVGVIGGFLKEGLKQLNLKEIMSDSMTLYYYTSNVGIRSLMASSIVAGNVERGTIIVDSTTAHHFTDEDHAFLNATASVIGQAVYNNYLYTEHKLQHGRLTAMSSIEKEFFRDLSMEAILDKIVEVIPFALPCDRLTLSLIDENGSSATIVRAIGSDAATFMGHAFSVTQKTLGAILYIKNIALSRNYSKEHRELRYFEEEPASEELRSFAAVPLGVDGCKGMILVESRKYDAYDESALELISRLSTSAGLAIEKIKILDKANALATHDGLTGLFNHRTFQQLLADEITRAIRYNEPVSLLICDIDFFKKINDGYGHPFGDVVLKGVASLLENSIRQDIDTASRYGGEEFALILVKTDEVGAVETAERIRQAIAAMIFKAPNGQDVQVTMSFGIAEYRKHARQLNDLIKKADKALYRAKENGRNCVEVF